MKRAIKWIGILVLLFLLLAAAAIFTFPYWFGSALGTAGQRFGVSFSKYERLEGGRFALTDLSRTNELFDFRASRVEGFMPRTWYQKVKGTNQGATFLEVNGWKMVVHPRLPVETNGTTRGKAGGKTSSEANEPSVYARWKEAKHYIAQAREWLPKATLLNGTVIYAGREYTFPVITWDEGKLDAGGVWPVAAVPVELKGKFTGEPPDQISFTMSPLDLRARLRLAETNEMLNATLALFYKETRVDVNANFGKEGFLPLNATVKAPNFKLPAELVKLPDYHDLTGSLSGNWQTNQYRLELKARAEPNAGTTLPSADIELAAEGTTNTVKILALRSTAPGLEVSISEPIEITYSGQLIGERSELKIAADLEKLPWLKLKGHFEGTLLLKRGEKFPIATIRAAGTKVEAFNVRAERVELAAVLDWPRLNDVKLTLALPVEARVELAGSGDLQARTLGATSLNITGLASTNLPALPVYFEDLSLTANLSGNVTNLAHEAKFEVRNFTAPQTTPLQLQGTWKARQITFEQLGLRARAGPAVLSLSGEGFAELGRTNLLLKELTLSKGDESYLALAENATVSLSANRRVDLSPLKLVGTNRVLEIGGFVQWPHEGEMALNATNVNPALFQNFITRSLREFELRNMSLAAHWSNGPLLGKMTGSMSIAQEELKRPGADLDLQLQQDGLALQEMTLWDATGEIGRAHGFLPLSVNLIEQPRLRFSPNDRIDFELQSGTNRAFWALVEKLAKVRLTNATVALKVHGRAARPTGELLVRADALRLTQTNRELPTIGPIDAHFSLNEQVLRIRDFSLRVLGQEANVTGNLKLGSNFWTQRREEIVKYAMDNANLQITAPEVKLAPFATYLPKYLSPEGELLANVAIKPGRKVDGRVEVRGVETRPLPKIGVVQSVRALIDVHENEVKIEELSGVLGGERMLIAGHVDISPKSVAKGYPDLDLAITGKNLPLARNPDVILRSDLNLRVHNGTNQVPIITGDATLRDSYLLRDISTLVPGRVARPSRRPPYFSIEQDPIDEWRLNVRVRGENFMRVRSPFFAGVVSANFHVVGTAAEPMALGEATISSGQIIFPFATLEVRQALVSLTAEDPYLPHIFAIAGGRAFGFEIRMQAEGPADAPVIQFSSVPALSSEQIVLMLTTGAIPREDFSFSNQDRVSKLAFFLGKSLLAKLRPGKPGEEKLTIRSGEDITEQGRQTYEVEYKLSPRWSLVGEYDRFGALNANVKWRLISR